MKSNMKKKSVVLGVFPGGARDGPATPKPTLGPPGGALSLSDSTHRKNSVNLKTSE